MEKEDSKKARITKALEKMIVSGRFKPGARIPSERALLKEFDASYMTLRAAVMDLARRGIVVRRGQSGSFLSQNAMSLVGRKKIHFIYNSWEGPFFAELLQCVARAIESAGCIPAITHFQEDFTEEVSFFLENGEAAILLGVTPKRFPDAFELLRSSAKKGRAPLVVIGQDADIEGTCGIKADDGKAMKLAIDRLKSAGHSRIMLTTPAGYLSGLPYERTRPWFEKANANCAPDERMKLLLGVRPEDNMHDLKSMALARLGDRKSRGSAMICGDNSYLLPLLSACYELKIRIPDDLSMIVLGDTAISAYMPPPITGVSVGLQAHMEEAMGAIMAFYRRGSFPKGRIFIEPKLIERESVMDLRRRP